MSKMTIYAQKSCNACRELVPILERITKQSGIALEVVDVDECHTKACDSVKYTPKIMYNNHEVKSAKDLKKILGAKIKSKRIMRKHS